MSLNYFMNCNSIKLHFKLNFRYRLPNANIQYSTDSGQVFKMRHSSILITVDEALMYIKSIAKGRDLEVLKENICK